MTTVLQLGKRTITAEEVIPLLSSYQMLPQLLRESIIDQAIASIECTSEETAFAYQQFYQQNQLTSDIQQQAWLERYCNSQNDLGEALIVRMLKIEKFKRATWGNKLESYFLKRKSQLDQVIYSLIRTKDKGIAEELYFRLQEREQTFAELAYEYSQGSEAQTGGIIGPVELGTIHPKLAQLLSISQPGQLWSPMPLEEWLLIVRLEKLIPAQLNDSMRRRLLRELFEGWLQQQLS
ncbi:peptidylprolyl isomerase [Brasilonema octagenarum UFV-E1]|uniref:peptidylprolyl isomerase n=2 Tax=Brasilonema TaxID=383614 RepID=A0A856MMJ0_9CYAN|nr:MULTISPECIES: peptidylprolyl isomerase [Brasilonema]NMF63029.1 peptidylprolyl isomerase [Brasilonema octagenarum UFV-OR1]QDL10741.1 peptidylprolyl isomerase [Brasilonema sennae CENA114]QDL17085.1 peptidylprolyl isomerase [Brasilonema octagenarum UFV-E1]